MLPKVFAHLLDCQPSQTIADPGGFAKALRIEWSAKLPCFHLTVAKLSSSDGVTKHALVSDITKTFDALGWFTPIIVKIKILLHCLWEAKIGWDETVPLDIRESWGKC